MSIDDDGGSSSTSPTRSRSPAAPAPASPSLPRLLRGLTGQASAATPSAPSVSRHASSSSASSILSPRSEGPPNLRRVRSSLLAAPSVAPPLLSPSTSSAELGDMLLDRSSTPKIVDEEGNDSDSSGFASILSRVAPPGLPHTSASSKGGKRNLSTTTQRPDTPASVLSDESSTNGMLGDPTSQTIQAARLAAESTRRAEEAAAAAQADQDDDDDEEVQQQGTESSGEDVDDDDEEGQVVRREQGQPDPREMLRKQLKRNESGFGTASGNVRREKVEGLKTLTPDLAEWAPRRYFVLSSAGKLIFTTEEDEENATGYVGVMQAIISIFADEGDKLRYVDAGTTKISFVLKAPLYLVCVSDWGEPESVLRTHLDYLYLQVLSVVTYSQLSGIFSKRSNFDLRRLMQGTEPFFFELVKTLQSSLAVLTSSLEVYRIDQATREEVAKALLPPKHKSQAQALGLLYAFVISSGRIVTLLRPTRHTIHPTDLHILLSTLSSSSTFQAPDSESWIPVCLPRFNNKGFLHVYISFLSSSTGIVLVSAEKDGFEGVKKWGEEVKKGLRERRLLDRIEGTKVKSMQDYSVGELAIPGVRHFLYKARAYVQITNPAFEGEYEVERNKMRLITLYQRVHDALHVRPAYAGGAARPPAKLIYLRTEHEAVLGWTTSSFELYLAVSPLLPKNAVVSAARAVTKWVKNEESRLFLTSAPSF